jgi:hypothetical protein
VNRNKEKKMATELRTKRRPGIPHETLEWIAAQAGGGIEHFLNGRDNWVRLTIAGEIFEGPNNTALLIAVLTDIAGKSTRPLN